MGIKMRVEKVTPELATHYLKRNVDNYRKISKAKAALYAEEMKAGNWQLNGEAIVFDKTGRLKNGQHRLAAVLMAGIPVEMTIIEGVDDGVSIFDSGLSRSTMQIARASIDNDISNTETATAAVIIGGYSSKVPKGKVLAWLKDNYADINRAYRICGAMNSRNLSRRVGCVLATYMALQLGELRSYELEVFFDIFNTGRTTGTDGYEPSSAIWARQQFTERYKAMPNDKKRLMEQVEILTMAMEDFKKGRVRQRSYQVREPMACAEMMMRVRKLQGLDDIREGA